MIVSPSCLQTASLRRLSIAILATPVAIAAVGLVAGRAGGGEPRFKVASCRGSILSRREIVHGPRKADEVKGSLARDEFKNRGQRGPDRTDRLPFALEQAPLI